MHRYHEPAMQWGDYAHPRVGINEHLARELSRFAARGQLDRLAILMSSATDPYQPLERKYRLSRACLEVFQRYPPALLNIQTRSPLVQEDFPLIRTLGDRCWINFTLETDREDVRRAITPRCPPLASRLEAIRKANQAGLNVQITVSPCLPFSGVESFGELLLSLSSRVVVDTFTTGDGMRGRRTAATTIPALFDGAALGGWRSQEAARELYSWLRERIGDRAGWSQEGFSALPAMALAAYGATNGSAPGDRR